MEGLKIVKTDEMVTTSNLREVIREELQSLMKMFRVMKQEAERFLTRTEAKEFLNISYSTLDRRVAKGIIKKYGQGSRVYFKLNELKQSLIPIN